MKAARKNILIGIFVISTIILACLLVFFAISYKNMKSELSDKEQQLNEYVTKVENLNSELTKYKAKILSIENTLKENATTSSENKTTEASTDSNEIQTENTTQEGISYEYDSGHDVLVEKHYAQKGFYYAITFTSDIRLNSYDYLNKANIVSAKEYKIEGLNNLNIMDIMVGRYGKDVNPGITTFLDDAGNVYVLKINNAFETGKFEVQKLDIKNCIKLETEREQCYAITANEKIDLTKYSNL